MTGRMLTLGGFGPAARGAERDPDDWLTWPTPEHPAADGGDDGPDKAGASGPVGTTAPAEPLASAEEPSQAGAGAAPGVCPLCGAHPAGLL